MLENKYWKRHKKLCSSAAAKSLLHKIHILVRSDKVFHAAHPRFIPTTFFPRDRVSADVFQNNEVLKWLLEVAYPLLEQSENDPWTKTYELAELKIERKIENGLDTLKNILQRVWEYRLLMGDEEKVRKARQTYSIVSDDSDDSERIDRDKDIDKLWDSMYSGAAEEDFCDVLACTGQNACRSPSQSTSNNYDIYSTH